MTGVWVTAVEKEWAKSQGDGKWEKKVVGWQGGGKRKQKGIDKGGGQRDTVDRTQHDFITFFSSTCQRCAELVEYFNQIIYNIGVNSKL